MHTHGLAVLSSLGFNEETYNIFLVYRQFFTCWDISQNCLCSTHLCPYNDMGCFQQFMERGFQIVLNCSRINNIQNSKMWALGSPSLIFALDSYNNCVVFAQNCLFFEKISLYIYAALVLLLWWQILLIPLEITWMTFWTSIISKAIGILRSPVSSDWSVYNPN